ncbi:MAG: hypothetical protein QOG01_4703 [Pseudonocardiales bacterium]|jgi:hypothetical protein|nr:hypothetical protein [Pseudonocardiales bacterium]
MTSFSLAAARARAARVRDGGDDAGFMMIYVLTIIGVITTVVGSTLVATSSSVVPAVQSAYDQAADAAAQGGLQAFVAYADEQCASASSSVADCWPLLENYSGVVDIPTPGSDDSYSATYSWIAAKDPSNRYFRVRSTGVVTQGGLSSTKVVIGDVVGGASLNVLDYGVVTGFESQSSATVLAEWPQRTIALDCTAVDAADVPIKGDNCSSNSAYLNSINWSGASPGTAAGKVAVCNATFDAKGGRGNNPPPKAPNPYVDWTESGLNGNNYTNFQPCQTAWGTMTKLLAPANPNNGVGGYSSNDALLLSNSYPGGSGPLFNQPVSTTWKYTTDDAGICSTAPGQNYRSFNLLCAGYPLEVGGAPSSASTYPTVGTGKGPDIPSTATIPATACVYAGPTRVVLNGDSAVVTSPQTTSNWVAANASTRPAQCYAGASATGMAAQTISLTTPMPIQVLVANNNGTVPKTTPATAHGHSGWPATGQTLGSTASTSNSVFYLSNGTSGSSASTTYTDTATPGTYVPATGDNPSTKTDGAWTPQWTTDTTAGCTSPPAPADLRFANCYIPKGSYADSYSWIKAGVLAAIAANPQNYTTAANFQTLVNSFVSQGNSADAAANSPTNPDYRSHRWNVSVSSGTAGGCTQSSGVAGTTTDTAISTPSTDPFYQNTAGNIHVAPSTDTSCYTATVTAQTGTCNVALALGLCVNLGNYVWGNGTALLGGGQSVAQFKVSFTAQKTVTTTTTTAATSTFPSMSDVTQYQLGQSGTFGASGPGDLYVEGTASHTMGLVAQGDAVLTGPLTPTDTATAALEVVGQDNVRVYHPVKCKNTNSSAIAATSAGFCPNDITGLYSSVPPTGTRPDQQYVNMRGDLADLTFHAAIFALGNDDAHITCPQPPNGGGVCGGEFSVDNYNRGAALGYLTDVGTVAMAHHAPVGQEWDIADTSGQTSRPYSGYQMAQQYQNIKALLSSAVDVGSVLHTTSSTSAAWHILSISSGPGS